MVRKRDIGRAGARDGGARAARIGAGRASCTAPSARLPAPTTRCAHRQRAPVGRLHGGRAHRPCGRHDHRGGRAHAGDAALPEHGQGALQPACRACRAASASASSMAATSSAWRARCPSTGWPTRCASPPSTAARTARPASPATPSTPGREVLARGELPGHGDIGALRLRTVATKDRPCHDFPGHDSAAARPGGGARPGLHGTDAPQDLNRSRSARCGPACISVAYGGFSKTEAPPGNPPPCPSAAGP